MKAAMRRDEGRKAQAATRREQKAAEPARHAKGRADGAHDGDVPPPYPLALIEPPAPAAGEAPPPARSITFGIDR
eukprot:4523481-Prymnesium_polylepis.1